MNKETVEGKFDQAAGKVKEKVGETVGNQQLANKGVAEQIKGAAKETWGKTKDTAAEMRNASRIKAQGEERDLKHRTERVGQDIREKVTSTTQNVKDKTNEKLDDIRHNQRPV